MTTFYRGPCARITHRLFESRCPVYQSFPLRHLSDVQVVEQSCGPPAGLQAARIASSSVAGATAVAGSLAWVEGWHILAAPVAAVLLLALFTSSLLAAGTCWWARCREQLLVAVYDGRPVTLFRSLDEHEFGQVTRALTRALDRLDDTR